MSGNHGARSAENGAADADPQMRSSSAAKARAKVELLPDPLIDAAIGWAVRLNYNKPTDAEREAFARWLGASPTHGIAWQRVNGFHGFQEELDSLSPKIALKTLESAQALRADKRNNGRRKALKLLSLSGVVAATGWVTREHLPWQRLLADACTGIGEQKTLKLDDGTVLVLNTDSAVNMDFSGENRVIVLKRGEILVTTGADADTSARLGAKRPFWVQTPYGRMQALGTRFTVRLDDANTRARVSVQEGAVALYPANGTPLVLPAGESSWLMADRTLPTESQGFAADDWANGVVAGKDIRLKDLLGELERYRVGRIVCDPRVADLRLSGLFHVKDTDKALQFLVQTQPLDVSYRTRFWVTVGPKGGL